MDDQNNQGFTLLEIMLVIVIIAMLAAVAMPRLAASAETAREKADITTAREVKSALDRYQVENGTYPLPGELRAVNGEVTGSLFIPVYIKKLDGTVTQQYVEDKKKGFGIEVLESADSNYPEAQNLIMIYLAADGSFAEVKAYDRTLQKVLWSSI